MTTEINLSGLQNATTVVDMVNYANQVTNNLAGGFLIITIFFLMMLGLTQRGHKFKDVILVSSFICFVLSIFGRVLGFVSVYFMLALLALFAFSGLFAFLKRETGT